MHRKILVIGTWIVSLHKNDRRRVRPVGGEQLFMMYLDWLKGPNSDVITHGKKKIFTKVRMSIVKCMLVRLHWFRLWSVVAVVYPRFT